MSRRNDKSLLVGLDIGTSKIACLVGELKDDDQIEIIGIGTHPSRGLKKGCGGGHRVHGAVDPARG
jgi:cell division protein FtsA